MIIMLGDTYEERAERRDAECGCSEWELSLVLLVFVLPVVVIPFYHSAGLCRA